MRSPLHIPPDELEQVITEAAEEYMREVRRIRRMALRNVLTNPSKADGSPVAVGEELEFLLEDLEALIHAGDHDQEKIHQLIDAMDPLTDVNEQGAVEWQRVRERVSQPRNASDNSLSRRKGKKRNKKRPK